MPENAPTPGDGGGPRDGRDGLLRAIDSVVAEVHRLRADADRIESSCHRLRKLAAAGHPSEPVDWTTAIPLTNPAAPLTNSFYQPNPSGRPR